MVSIFILLFLTLTFASVSSQHIQSQNSTRIKDFSQDYYLDACKAVLQGVDKIGDPEDTWKKSFSTWENTSPYRSLLNYFENDTGIVSKVWIVSGAMSSSWNFKLALYDGQYADNKFAMVEFEILDAQSSDYDPYSGVFQTQGLTAYVSYGENNQIQYTHDFLGQITIYFLDADSQQPISDYYTGADITGDTVKITFSSSDSLLSFSTTLFTETYYDKQFSLIAIPAFLLVYVISGLASAGTSALIAKVQIGYIAFACLSSTYIVFWMLLHCQNLSDSMNLALLFVAVFDLIKQAVFLKNKVGRFPCCLTLVILMFGFAFNGVPSIWCNLLPAATFVLPFLVKLVRKQNPREQYLNRYHISNWICSSLWMGYFYFYPSNLFLISPHVLLIEVFFGIILVLFILSSLMEKSQRRRQQQQHYISLLLDNEAQQNVIHQPLIQQPVIQPVLQNNQNIVAPQVQVQAQVPVPGQSQGQGPRGRPQANPNREKRPRRKTFKYTFAEQGEQEEEYTGLTDECAICFDFLLGDHPDKLYKTPCGHIFHEGCLRAWGVKKLECPCCRKKLPGFKNQSIN